MPVLQQTLLNENLKFLYVFLSQKQYEQNCQIKHFQNRKRRYHPNYLSDKSLKGIFVNRALEVPFIENSLQRINSFYF